MTDHGTRSPTFIDLLSQKRVQGGIRLAFRGADNQQYSATIGDDAIRKVIMALEGPASSLPQIVALQGIAHLDDHVVEIVFHGPDRTASSIRLPGRGIFDLRDEIESLLEQNPEIHEWQSRPAN